MRLKVGSRGGFNLPDDVGECPACGAMQTGIGMCTECWDRRQKLIDKADRLEGERRRLARQKDRDDYERYRSGEVRHEHATDIRG